MNRWIGLFLLTTMAALIGACASPPPSGSEAGPLRVGLTPIYPPLVFKEAGRLQGVEPDFAEALAVGLERSIEYFELPWESLIPALEERRIDVIMSGMSRTSRRAERVAFTEPYLKVGQMALIRAADVERLGSVTALLSTPARVGYVEETTGADFVTANMPQSTRVPLASTDDGVTALEASAIDVFVHDAPTVWRIAGSSEHGALMGLFWPLTDEVLAWAVHSEDEALRGELNALLAEWRASGYLEQILRKWMPLRILTE